MACFSPLDAWQTVDGSIVFVERGDILRVLSLPCGQCVGCRLERSRQWAVRCVHESACHDFSSFVTLTYDDEHVPCGGDLIYRHFQLFMKRLRRECGPVRFYMCGEYGDEFKRPHFHACLFGCFFKDRVLYRDLPSGFKLYTSALLARLWPFGFSSIGDVTFESAAYVARYVVKKVTGSRAEEHYLTVDGDTGEITYRVPEFCRMSLKPGIGAKWFERFSDEVYPNDFVVIRGVKMRPPRYYDVLFSKMDGFIREFSDVELARMDRAQSVAADNTPARLAVRKVVTTAKLKLKLRTVL